MPTEMKRCLARGVALLIALIPSACASSPSARPVASGAELGAATPVATARPSPAPTAAASPDSVDAAVARDAASLRALLDSRWAHWSHGNERVAASDLDDEAANPAVRGDEAAAVAALLQQLNRLRTRDGTEGIDFARLKPAEQGGDAEIWKALLASYRQNLQKSRLIPTELWAREQPTFAAVRQAREGDCWLLATTGWMVRFRPEVVRNAIEPAGENRWRVRFASGDTVEVFTPTTTELLAVNSAATLRDGLWLPVVKEAMGTLLGETNARKQKIEAESLRVNGGSGSRMLQRWTGHKVRVWRLEGQSPIETVRAAITDGIARKAAMGAGTPREPKGRIPPNHAFAIFGFDAARDTVLLWNPWGNNFTPKGPDGREHGYTHKAGISEMPLADFTELFRGLWIETDEPLEPRAAG